MNPPDDTARDGPRDDTPRDASPGGEPSANGTRADDVAPAGAPSGDGRRRSRISRGARVLARLLGLLSLAIAFALFLFTQTTTGRNAAVALLQGVLNDAVHGEVRFGPVLGGNLLTRIVLSRFEIADTAGATFVALDTVTLEYDPLALLRRQVRFRRLEARRAEIRLDQGPSGIWNHQRIFGIAPDTGAAVPDTAPVEGTPFRLLFNDATVHDGIVEIRTPWTERLEGAEREAALAEATGGPIWHVERTAGGEWERVYRIENLQGSFPSIRLVDPPRPFRIELDDVGGRLLAVSQPLDVTGFTGEAVFEDTIRVDIARMTTGHSRLSGEGWVVPEPLRFDFELAADPLGFEDLEWLPVPVPDSGGGPMELRIASRGEITVVTVTDGSVRSEESRIRGDLTLVLDDPPRFEDLDLELDPVRLAWVDRILERPSLVDGRLRGTLRGAGPIDALGIDADVTLAPLAGGAPPSSVRARGRVSLVEPHPVRDLRLDLEAFDPRWVAVLGFESPLSGRLGGAVTVDRPGDGTLSAAGALTHRTPQGDVSRVEGTGTIDLEGGSVIDVAVRLDPLALAALRPWFPDLDLVGSVSGPLRARGDLSDLLAEADLTTARGRLQLGGRFDFGDKDRPRYDARVEASDVALDQWIEGAPASRLAVRGSVDGEGVELETLNARFDLEILPSVIDRAEIDTSRVRFHIADGMAEIDTLVLRSDVGTVTGRGRFGLREDRVGTVEFETEVPDLSALNRWFAPDVPARIEAEEGPRLFEDFETALAVEERDTPDDGLRGRLSARGVVVGTRQDFSLEAFLEATGAGLNGYGADSLAARVALPSGPSLDRISARVVAEDADLAGIALDSLDASVSRERPGAVDFDVHARRDTTVEFAASGSLEADSAAFDMRLERLRARTGKVEATLAGPARLLWSDSGLVVDGLVLTGPLGRLEADGRIPATGSGELTVALSGFRIDQLAYLFSNAPEVGGTLYASSTIRGTLSEPRWQGTARILDPSIREHRYTALEAGFEYGDRRLDGSIDLTRDGYRLAHAEGTVRADLSFERVERRLLEEPLDVRVQADSMPLQTLELRVRGLERLEGFARGSVTLAGEPGDLRYGGEFSIVNGEAWVPDLGVTFLDAWGHATFRGSAARIDSLTFRSAAGGSAAIRGAIDVSSLADAEFDLDLSVDRLHAVARRDMSLEVDGEGHLGGSYREPLLTGRFRLRDGDIRQDEFLRQQRVLDLSDPSFYGLLDSAAVVERRLLDRFRNPFMDNLRVDVALDLGPNLWLRSPQLDVEMVASGLDVRMDRAADIVEVRGIVELPRGTYRFDRIPPYVQQLRITSGTIRFTGGRDFNPALSIVAEYRSRTAEGPVTIEAHIGGTLQNTDLTLTSNPAMSDTDQLCFLAVGAPCFAAADEQLGQRLLQEGVLGTLSSGLSSALVGSSGLSYFSLRSLGGGSARGLSGSQGLFDQTAVEFGWYASEEVFFTFSQPLGGGVPRATLEWRFTQNWTLEARTASRLDQRLYGLFGGTNLENDRTFGLFLFREWSF